MIGRFVHQQQVRARKQQFRQQGARALPARKLLNGAFFFAGAETQPGQTPGECAFVGIAAQRFEFVLQPPIRVSRILSASCRVAHRLFELDQFGLPGA